MADRIIFHVDANSAFLSWTAAYRVNVLKESLESKGAELGQLQSELRELKDLHRRCINSLNEQRLMQLHLMMPQVKRRYRVLQLKKMFSFGKRRRKYKEKIRELRTLLREYRYESSKMWDNR